MFIVLLLLRKLSIHLLIMPYLSIVILASTIISIRKDMRAALCKSDKYRGISLFNAICKVLLCIYVTSFYIHLKCNLDLNKCLFMSFGCIKGI